MLGVRCECVTSDESRGDCCWKRRKLKSLIVPDLSVSGGQARQVSPEFVLSVDGVCYH